MFSSHRCRASDLLQYPVRNRASPLRASKELRTTQHSMVLMNPVLTQTMDIITDPKCNRTIAPDMALDNSLGPDTTPQPQQQHGPQAPAWSKGADSTPGIHRAFIGY